MHPAHHRAPLELARPGLPLVAFALAFTALIGAGQIAVRTVPRLAATYRVARTIRYPDSSWYLASAGGPDLDHYVLFHGLGGSIDAAREADILVLGNSRTQFALPHDPLRAFEARHGVKIFHLGFGFTEGNAFPLGIIEKFDLRPKLVIVGVDGFASGQESLMAREVRSTQRWAAAKVVSESFASAEVMPWLTAIFPRLLAPPPKPYLLRSATNGSWRPVSWQHHDMPLVGSLPFDTNTLLPEARRFKAEMDRRGAKIVLFCPPGTPAMCTPEITRSLARQLGVAAIVPSLQNLKSGDDYHLCPASGERFAHAFLHQLGRSPELRAIARR